MPAWALIPVAIKIVEKLTEVYKAIIDLSMLIFDRLADLSFALFICHETADEERKKWLLDRYRDWILISIYANNPTLFTVLNYSTIVENHYFKLFWNSDPVLKANLKAVEKAIETQNQASSALDFIINALSNTFMFKFIATLIQTFTQPIQFVNEYAQHILNAYHANKTTEQVAINQILDKFKPEQVKEVKLFPPKLIIETINPVLAFSTPQIFAHILSFYAYSKIIHMRKCKQPPEQLLKFLYADVTLNKQKIAKIHPSDNLDLVIDIPKDKFKPFAKNEVCFDYAGIKKCVDVVLYKPLIINLVGRGQEGYMACYTGQDVPFKQEGNEWRGDWFVDCTTAFGDAYTLIYLIFEHNYEGEPFTIEIDAGAYRQACYGTAYLVIGQQILGKWRFFAVAEVKGTTFYPQTIKLTGSFPSPFAIGVYHYCPTAAISVSGARITRVKAYKTL